MRDQSIYYHPDPVGFLFLELSTTTLDEPHRPRSHVCMFLSSSSALYDTLTQKKWDSHQAPRQLTLNVYSLTSVVECIVSRMVHTIYVTQLVPLAGEEVVQV